MNEQLTVAHESYEREQPALPFYVQPWRKVSWINATQAARRGFLSRRRKSVQFILDEGSQFPQTTKIEADRIAEVTDPDLRYALRFADAADAAGWEEVGPYTRRAHSVTVVATDEGLDSRLINATYTGIANRKTDTFLENFYRFGPAE